MTTYYETVHHTYPESFNIVCITPKLLFSVTSKNLSYNLFMNKLKLYTYVIFYFPISPLLMAEHKLLFFFTQHPCTWEMKINEMEVIPVSNAKQHEGPYSTFPSILLTIGCIHTHHNFNVYLVLTMAVATITAEMKQHFSR